MFNNLRKFFVFCCPLRLYQTYEHFSLLLYLAIGYSAISTFQTVQTLIRGLLQEPSDLGLHCLKNFSVRVYKHVYGVDKINRHYTRCSTLTCNYKQSACKSLSALLSYPAQKRPRIDSCRCNLSR